MDRIDDLYILTRCQFLERVTNILQRLTEVFAPMSRDCDQSLSIWFSDPKSVDEGADFRRFLLLYDIVQCIDDRVACYLDGTFVHAFAQQIGFCPGGGGETQVSDYGGDAAIDFFGEGMPIIVGSYVVRLRYDPT